MNHTPAIALALLPGFALFLGACGKKTEPEPEASRLPTIPNTRPAPPPQKKQVLPTTGDITTSAPGAPKPPELTKAQKEIVLNRMMNKMAEAQAQGLGGGTVKVNGAWQYAGYSYLAPNPDSPLPARLVAVDVSFEGHNVNFDVDDIEIIDGISMVSYGSDPHVTFLAGEAEPLAEGTPPPVAPNPTRALLIYAFPKSTPKFTLYYWGKNLLDEPMTLKDSGWGLPYPKDPE